MKSNAPLRVIVLAGGMTCGLCALAQEELDFSEALVQEEAPVEPQTPSIAEPLQAAPAVDYDQLLQRLDKLEATVQGLREDIESMREDVIQEPIVADENVLPEPSEVDESETVPLAPMMSEDEEEPIKPQPSEPAISSAYNPAEKMFKAGRVAFRNLDFFAAGQTFTAFLVKYPNHERAVEAYYWLGETLYEQGKFAEAIESLRPVLEGPESAQRLVARLKTGYALYELGEYKKAKVMLLEIVEIAPDSNMARLAQLRLERLQRQVGNE